MIQMSQWKIFFRNIDENTTYYRDRVDKYFI